MKLPTDKDCTDNNANSSQQCDREQHKPILAPYLGVQAKQPGGQLGGAPATSKIASFNMSRTCSLLAAIATTLLSAAFAAKFSIGVLSDGPYGIEQVQDLPLLINEVNANTDLRAVVHLGDIKAGGDMCNNSYFNNIKTEFFDKIQAPLLYTPGDNEWTDCHRESNGNYNPLERLYTLRRIFFPSLGKSSGAFNPLPVSSQAQQAGFEDYVENSLWNFETVVMATIHVVGSNNNRDPWADLPEGDDTEARVDEYEMRDEAALAWLEKTFKRAMNMRAEGVLLFIHGGMWPHFELANGMPLFGFDRFAQALARYSAAFQNPVWMFNGDTHDFVRLTPFTEGATHPTTKFYGKPNVPIYRIHGEQFDAPNFVAFTAETKDQFDSEETDEDYDERMIWEWIEVKVNPGARKIFDIERHWILL